MAITMPPPSPDTVADVRSSPTIPVVHREGRRTVIALRGESDLSTRRVLCDVLCRAIALRSGDVVIDLAEATFVDTAIVRALAETQQLLDLQGRKLTFRSPSRLAARVLHLFGLADRIETPEGVAL
jgi:anti-anti-sigma factor